MNENDWRRWSWIGFVLSLIYPLLGISFVFLRVGRFIDDRTQFNLPGVVLFACSFTGPLSVGICLICRQHRKSPEVVGGLVVGTLVSLLWILEVLIVLGLGPDI